MDDEFCDYDKKIDEIYRENERNIMQQIIDKIIQLGKKDEELRQSIKTLNEEKIRFEKEKKKFEIEKKLIDDENKHFYELYKQMELQKKQLEKEKQDGDKLLMSITEHFEEESNVLKQRIQEIEDMKMSVDVQCQEMMHLLNKNNIRI
jgi:hypothetical protein